MALAVLLVGDLIRFDEGSEVTVAVLKAAGLMDFIETRVDGVVSADIGLKGKPAPDIFLTAAARLKIPITDCLVIEDSENGVCSAKAAAGQVFVGQG